MEEVRWVFSVIEEIDGEIRKTTYYIKKIGDEKIRVVQRIYGKSDYLWVEYEYELSPDEFVELLIHEHDPKTIIHSLIGKILFEKSLATLKT